MNTTPQSIFVTGGAGYIGSILVPKLLALGHRVTVLDNFMYGQASLLDCCHSDKLTIIRGDARDTELVTREVAQADVIMPLACLVGAPLCKERPHEAKSINLDAITMLADATRPDQKIIVPISNSGYGVGESGMFCTEDSPLRPVSLYGKLKVELEDYLLAKGNAVSLRLATVFGASPRMRLDLLVNDFTYRAVTDRCVVLFEAHFKRNYLHVQDAAGAFIHAMEHFDEMKGRPYNVGLSEANLSKKELCEVIREQVPAFYVLESEIGEDPDKRDYIVSNERIEATGYATQVTLAQGIRELIRAYQIIRRNTYGNV